MLTKSGVYTHHEPEAVVTGDYTDLPLSSAFLCVAAILSHALTGWITGTAVALCFNVIAKKTGGIVARFVSVVNDESVTTLA